MKKNKHLTYEDMVKLETLLEEGIKVPQIAIRIGKDKTTLYRCVKENADEDGFHAETAWEKVKERKSRANSHPRILSDSMLEKYIIERIESYWSPEQIAGRWTEDTGESLCHETIYQYLYHECPELVKVYLRRKGKKYQNK